MIRGLLTILSFFSVLLLPWPVTALLVLGTAPFVPLVPLAIGLFADALYHAPGAVSLPYATLAGALVSLVAYAVRNRLAPDIIE